MRYRQAGNNFTRQAPMGLMDRDYMNEKHRQRPFSPPPDRFNLGTLGKVLVFVAALLFLYQAADWKLKHDAKILASQAPAGSALKLVPHSVTAPIQAFSSQPADRKIPEAAAGTSSVTKCVANGKTSYSDAACPQGATSVQVTVHPNHNLMAAVRPQAVTPAQELAHQDIVVTHNTSFNDVAAKKSACQSLDARIEHLDALARQPQSGQTQDWIRDERKKARDQQFRIPCR